jgi:aryl-alcohol dehydrogenase-like predicted oxidoreductase
MADTSISLRPLGQSDLRVYPIGLGCMGMSFAYGPADEKENLRVLQRFLDLGGNFLDTAEVYGPFTNEELLGRFLKNIRREQLVVVFWFSVNWKKRPWLLTNQGRCCSVSC